MIYIASETSDANIALKPGSGLLNSMVSNGSRNIGRYCKVATCEEALMC
jgi:hypothetical protein